MFCAEMAREREETVNPNKALWEKGDFTRIATSMRESSEALADSRGTAPQRFGRRLAPARSAD
jgi:hypothetical protein